MQNINEIVRKSIKRKTDALNQRMALEILSSSRKQGAKIIPFLYFLIWDPKLRAHTGIIVIKQDGWCVNHIRDSGYFGLTFAGKCKGCIRAKLNENVDRTGFIPETDGIFSFQEIIDRCHLYTGLSLEEWERTWWERVKDKEPPVGGANMEVTCLRK